MAYDIKLEGKNLEEALFLLEKTVSVLDDIKQVYWLEGGTLLGVRREDRLLPWDNDVDLSLMYEDDCQIERLVQELKNNGFRVRIHNHLQDKTYCKKGDPRIIKLRRKILFGLLKGPVCLEIFVKYKKDNDAHWKIGQVEKHVPYRFYKEVKRISFNGKEYSVPELTDEYLTFRYGDWQIQKKEYNPFKDDNALKK